MKYYKIVYTCPVAGTFKDRNDGRQINYHGGRVCVEQWQSGGQVPESLLVYKSMPDIDLQKLPLRKPCLLGIDSYKRITAIQILDNPPA